MSEHGDEGTSDRTGAGLGALAGGAAVGAASGAAVAGPLGAALGAAAGSVAGAALSGMAPHAVPATAQARGPYVASDPGRPLGRVVPNGQCVAYVKDACSAPHTAAWRRGGLVKGSRTLAPGTAIATFDPDGTYGNHVDGRSHAAVYMAQDAHGLVVLDQWVGQPVHQRTIRFGGEKPVNDGDKFFVIL